jgi:hypothetical protein
MSFFLQGLCLAVHCEEPHGYGHPVSTIKDLLGKLHALKPHMRTHRNNPE